MFSNAKKIAILLVAAPIVALLVVPVPTTAVVAPHNVEPKAKVSFTFDDGLTNALTQAAPTLAAHGLTGTSFITTGCVGMSTWPNDCPADPDVTYMTWEEIAQLRSQYGWEIGGHSVDHPELATHQLTDEELVAEIAGGKQALIDHGFNPVNFAAPYGDYDNRVLAEVAKSYASLRGFWDFDPNMWPYNNFVLSNMQVQAGVSLSSVLARIDQAIASKEWLILTFHGIEPHPSFDPEDYQYSTTGLNAIAAYVKSKQDVGLIKAVNIEDGLVTSTTNLFPNPDLTNGLAQGWTTDTPATTAADSGNHGSYPEPQHAALLTAAASGNTHLYSPKVPVLSSKTYMLHSFVNLFARTGGELGYYIDEYNINGDWISGQWKGAKAAPTVTNAMFTYTPSSPQVAKARLQVYVTPGSGIQAYVDSFRWYPLEDTETPPVATENQLPNSDFINGIADGWTTNDVVAFTSDNTNNGAPESPEHAIKLLSGGSNSSLFAPTVDINHAVEYNVSAYLNIQTLEGGEVAFYIDEYDVGGNWVSGQYKAAKRDTGIEIITFTYVASSSAVKKAGLQIILVANAGITGYLDEAKFLAPAGSSPPPPGDNLVANGTFDAGLADGWTTNSPATVTVDASNQGSPNNPENSIKLVSAADDQHLFSPLVVLSLGSSYSLAGYLDLRQISSGEIGFYIDEYDLDGNWISGQYAMAIAVISAGDFGFAYLPTSGTVAQSSLQIIVAGNANIEAYLDDIRWYAN